MKLIRIVASFPREKKHLFAIRPYSEHSLAWIQRLVDQGYSVEFEVLEKGELKKRSKERKLIPPPEPKNARRLRVAYQRPSGELVISYLPNNEKTMQWIEQLRERGVYPDVKLLTKERRRADAKERAKKK